MELTNKQNNKMEASVKATSLMNSFLESEAISWHEAKRCAKICVYEIIEAIKEITPEKTENTILHPIDYWEQVIVEINNL